MNLHTDQIAFSVIIDSVAERTNYRKDVLEKDYYVCLILKELSELQEAGLKTYFKGGTAVYKILGNLMRFSEDIDLTVNTEGLNNTQKAKMLKKSTEKYISLNFNRNLMRMAESLTAEYIYTPIYTVETDPLQRFGMVKVESTSFTVSEPIKQHVISPLIYSYATDVERQILETNYSTGKFHIITLSLERIFIDKLFAAESYFAKHKYFDVCKHLYDIFQLYQLDEIKFLMRNASLIKSIVKIQREEEINRHGGIEETKTIKSFEIFGNLLINLELLSGFNSMQNIYVFDVVDCVNFEKIVSTLGEIFLNIKDLSLETI